MIAVARASVAATISAVSELGSMCRLRIRHRLAPSELAALT